MRNLSRVTILFFFFISAGTAAAEKIDINTAPLEDLVKIIHIGEIRASELISLRPFSSLDELTKIKGIGEMRLKDIKEQGLAWVAPQPQLEPQSQPQPEPQPKSEPLFIGYPSAVIINEILPSPTGPDETDEWIEIFNQNIFEVDLTGWQITDTKGAIKTYNFPENRRIAGQSFLVLLRPETKITLNNDGDGLKLIQPDGKITNEVSFEKAIQGQSYNRADSGWQWSDTLTPGEINVISLPEAEKKENSNLIKESERKSSRQQDLAAASEPLGSLGKTIFKNPFSFPFLIALSLSLVSGTAVLVLKKRLK